MGASKSKAAASPQPEAVKAVTVTAKKGDRIEIANDGFNSSAYGQPQALVDSAGGPPKPAEPPRPPALQKAEKSAKALAIDAVSRNHYVPPPTAGDGYSISEPGTPHTPGTRHHGPKKVDIVGVQTDGQQLARDLPAAVTVPDEATHWMAILGESTTRSLHSQDWKMRESALQMTLRNVSNSKWLAERPADATWKCLSEVLSSSLKDKVAPIYYVSLDLLNIAATSYSGVLPHGFVENGLEPIMPTLLHRCGNNNSRIQELTIQSLLNLASQPSLGLGYVANYALGPIPKKSQGNSASAQSQMAGRLELLSCMLNMEAQQALGLGMRGNGNQPREVNVGGLHVIIPPSSRAAGRAPGGTALLTDDVLKFARPALEIADDKVRAAAVSLIGELYRRHKAGATAAGADPFEPERVLGPGLKPAMLQVLHKKFAEVDEELRTGISGATVSSRVNIAGSAPAGTSGLDDIPVGNGVSIKVSQIVHLPPINQRGGVHLPPVDMASMRGHLPTYDSPSGKPPRTPARARTPMRSRDTASPSRRTPPTTPPRTASPMRSQSLLPGALPNDELDAVLITSGASTPMRVSRNASLKAGRAGGARSSSGTGERTAPRVLDETEEQLIDYILNQDHR